MAMSPTERLKQLYSIFNGDDQVLVVINADPDSIASAMAIKRLLWHQVAGVTITPINAVKRPDNLAMIRLLGVHLTPIAEIERSHFSRFVLVDSQPDHHELFQTFTWDVIIDHHPDSGIQAPFIDIRPRYGANSSILTEYIRAARIKPSIKLATGLFYAIKTDTSNFQRRAQIEDVRAFQFLFRRANVQLISKIEQSELKPEFLKYYRIALERMRMRKGKLFVHLGSVVSPDVCVLIADFFIRVTNVAWSIVSGRYEKKLVIVFRNDGIRKNAGALAKRSFGGMGSAGGHKSMARAEIAYTDIKSHSPITDDGKLAWWVIREVEKK